MDEEKYSTKHEAIYNSILKWKRIYEFLKDKDEEDIRSDFFCELNQLENGMSNCALCQRYYGQSSSCNGCPVDDDKHSGCAGTPYDKFHNLKVEIQNAKIYEHYDTILEDLTDASVKEMYYLIGLLSF